MYVCDMSSRATGVRTCVRMVVCVQKLFGRGSMHVKQSTYLYVSVDCDCVCPMRYLCLVSFGGYTDTWSVVDSVWDYKSTT